MESIAGVSHHRMNGLFDLSQFERDCVFFFDLEEVLQRAKSHWLNDRERLRAICERQVRNVTPHDLLVFGSTGFFLIAAAGAETDAHLRAGQVNLSLLQLFFGAESLGIDQTIRMFRAATVDEVRAASPHFKPPVRAQERGVAETLLVPDKIQFAFVPIEDFRSGRTSALFCTPFRRNAMGTTYGYRALSASLKGDPEFDLVALDHALSLTHRLMQSGLYAAVGAPVGYETLSRPRWRDAYQRRLRASNAVENPLLLLKIDAVPVGITSSRLADIVHCLRPLARRVFVHLPEHTRPMSQTGLLGATGFVTSLPSRIDDEQVTEETNRLIRFCTSQGALSGVDNIESRAHWNLVRAAGARFGIWAVTDFSGLSAETHLAALAGETAAAS